MTSFGWSGLCRGSRSLTSPTWSSARSGSSLPMNHCQTFSVRGITGEQSGQLLAENLLLSARSGHGVGEIVHARRKEVQHRSGWAAVAQIDPRLRVLMYEEWPAPHILVASGVHGGKLPGGPGVA